ncbi:unnamed protein product [Caenorhabditis angaria]|uniref:Uncharacterized protein n=1 Tax=Caenorhabditis angaria TaxID=860376 RepID=A0A9P1N533_9PELO|nr:unnamed protein product [Caenorhabditis angaria]
MNITLTNQYGKHYFSILCNLTISKSKCFKIIYSTIAILTDEIIYQYIILVVTYLLTIQFLPDEITTKFFEKNLPTTYPDATLSNRNIPILNISEQYKFFPTFSFNFLNFN